MGAEFRVESTGGEDRVDDPQIVENLKCARLNALAARSREGLFGGLDQTKRYPAALKIQRKRQPGWSSSDNQYIFLRHRDLSYTVRTSIVVRCTNVKDKDTS